MSEIAPKIAVNGEVEQAKTPQTTLEVMRYLGQAINTPVAENETPPTMDMLLKKAITPDVINDALSTNRGIMGTYRDPSSQRMYRFANDEAKVVDMTALIARQKAREVLANGINVAETMEDVNTWHALVRRDDLAELSVAPVRNDKLMPIAPQASEIIDAIARVGEQSQEFLTQKAAEWVGIHYSIDNHQWGLGKLASNMMRSARNQLGNTKTDFRVRDLTDEFHYGVASPKIFFAANLHRLTGESYALPDTARQIINHVQDVAVQKERARYYEGLNIHMKDILSQKVLVNEFGNKKTDDYLYAGSKLLERVLEFAGNNSQYAEAKGMAEYIRSDNVRMPRHQIVAQQTGKILALANHPGLRKHVGRTIKRNDRRPATLPQLATTINHAADRILLAVNSMAREKGADEATLRTLASVSDCVVTMLNYGQQDDSKRTMQRAS